MKRFQAFFFLLLTVSLAFCAGDSRWVNSSFKWRGTGVVCTEVFPLFSDLFRVSYSSPKGSLKITLVDVSDDHKRLADKVVVDSWHQTLPERKEYSGRSKAYLLIEGASAEWQVTVDQYLDTIQEWTLMNSDSKKDVQKPQKKVAVWASEGPSEIEYAPKAVSWRISTKNDDGAPVRVSVMTKEEKPRVLFKGLLRKDNAAATGWIHCSDPVMIKVECAEDSGWSIDVSQPQ
ncbi:MAG: hypothetical protein MJ106_02575 [Lentisphaeria bacterium]|nr:hypothetical protein [Lentisphaeria bacterium]